MPSQISSPEITGFKILEESWTDYELEDGTIVRLRPVLAFIHSSDEKERMGFTITPLILSWSPQELRNPGKAGEKASVEVLDGYIEQDNLKYRCVAEGHSRYVTPLGPLTIQARAIRFKRTSLFDPQGQPQYIISQTFDLQKPSKTPLGRKSAKRKR